MMHRRQFSTRDDALFVLRQRAILCQFWGPKSTPCVSLRTSNPHFVASRSSSQPKIATAKTREVPIAFVAEAFSFLQIDYRDLVDSAAGQIKPPPIGSCHHIPDDPAAGWNRLGTEAFRFSIEPDQRIRLDT